MEQVSLKKGTNPKNPYKQVTNPHKQKTNPHKQGINRLKSYPSKPINFILTGALYYLPVQQCTYTNVGEPMCVPLTHM
jgi:hypothetical protein